MGFVFLLVRIALGGFFAWRGVRYLDPYARQAAIATARAKGSSSSELAFVTMGLMMLTGGICIVMGIAPGVGVAAAVIALAIDASWRLRNAATKRTTADRIRTNRGIGRDGSFDAARATPVAVFIHRLRRGP